MSDLVARLRAVNVSGMLVPLAAEAADALEAAEGHVSELEYLIANSADSPLWKRRAEFAEARAEKAERLLRGYPGILDDRLLFEWEKKLPEFGSAPRFSDPDFYERDPEADVRTLRSLPTLDIIPAGRDPYQSLGDMDLDGDKSTDRTSGQHGE